MRIDVQEVTCPVERHYIEPTWYAELLTFQFLRWAYYHVPYAHMAIDRYAPADGLDWPYSIFARVTIEGQVRALAGVSWIYRPLAWVGIRPIRVDLAIEIEYACKTCGQMHPECRCTLEDIRLVPVDYRFFLNGEEIEPAVFQVDFDRFYRVRASGQLFERVPRGALQQAVA